MMIRTALALSLALATALPASAACETPSFQAMIPSITATSDITDLVFGDLGNDGDLDLVTVSESVTEFGVEVHIDDDGFLPPFAVAGSRPTAVALADMNGDGQLDIVITEKAANSEECRLFGSCASLREIRVGANGGFTDVSEPRVIPFIDSVKRIVAADFNKDGEMDVLVAGPPINGGDPSLHLIWGTDPDSGTIASSTIQTFNTNGPIADVVLGDFDNDTFIDFAAAVGKSDLTTAGHVDLYRNDAGAFSGVTATKDLPSTDSTLRLSTGQYNKTDTRLDIAVAMKTTTLFPEPFVGGGIAIVLSNGTALAAGGTLATSPGTYWDAAAVDADEDNDLDVALGGGAVFFFNSGNSTLSKQGTPSGTTARVFGADFNRDGRDDVAYLGSSRSVAILLNACPSRYRALTLSASPSPRRSAAAPPSP
jgi:large repetitive protein